MMGERESQTPLWNYRVNLDKRVRRDHQLRRINEVLELSFVACTGTNPQLAFRPQRKTVAGLAGEIRASIKHVSYRTQ
jgi:hypothetical protein